MARSISSDSATRCPRRTARCCTPSPPAGPAAGDGALPLRGLRPDARRRPVVRQPALPELPARQGRGLAREADRSPAAVPVFPGHLHPAVGAAGCRARHQRAVYAALFGASSEALRTLAADPKYLGTDRLGFFGVLHTWGRTLEYHPHVHYVVPGGGLSAERDRWLASRADFLVPVKALSIIFRAKFRDRLRDEGLLEQVDPSVWRRDWVVHCQSAGDGRESLRYLAPYVFRVAIGDHRIVSCDDGRVTFTYRKVGSKRQRKMTLDAQEFLRRYLQHVLPSGFPKVRHFGFLSPASGVSLDLVRWLIALWAGLMYVLRSDRDEEPAASPGEPVCPTCGGRLLRLGFVPAVGPAVFDTS